MKTAAPSGRTCCFFPRWARRLKILLTKICGFAILSGLGSPALAQKYGPPENILSPPYVSSDPVMQAEIARKQRKELEQQRAKDILPWQIASTALDVADIVSTKMCSDSPRCREKNSLYGIDNPSLGRILAIKVPEMAFSWVFGREIAKKSPIAGRVFYSMKGIVTGKNVFVNFRIVM